MICSGLFDEMMPVTIRLICSNCSRMDRMMNSMMNSMMGGMGMGFMDPFEMLNPMNSMNQLALRHALDDSVIGNNSSNNRHNPMSGSISSAVQPFLPHFPHHRFPHQMFAAPATAVTPAAAANSYSSFSSSIVTMTSDGMGRPQVYEASSSTRTGPGGVRETKSSVRDSRTGRHEMSIGHHIRTYGQDKSHVVKKSKNVFTGQEDHEEDFVNVEEDEEAEFESEWRRRANGYQRTPIDSNPSTRRYGDRTDGLTITELPAEEPLLALPAPPVAPSEPRNRSHESSSHRRLPNVPHRVSPVPRIRVQAPSSSSSSRSSPIHVLQPQQLQPGSGRRDARRENRSRGRDKPY